MTVFLKKTKRVLWLVFLFSLLFSFNSPRVGCCVLVAILIHELGHSLTLTLLGKGTRGIFIRSFGARMHYSGTLSYREELLVCLGGPISNLLVALLSLLLLVLGRDYFLLFCTVNLFYFLSNLFPIPSYDGEKILRILLSYPCGADTAERVVHAIGFFLRAALLFLSLYLIFYFDIAYPVFVCIFASFIPDFTHSAFSDKV